MRPAEIAVLASFMLLGCSDESAQAQHAQAEALGQALIQSCPPAAPNDVAAWHSCVEHLDGLDALRDTMKDPFVWGQQPRLWDYDLSHFKATEFSPLVFRRMYLSLFTFDEFSVEQAGDVTVLHMHCGFRNGLDSGEYPYPFWHLPQKWRDYQMTTEVLLLLKRGRIEGALRSAVRLTNRPYAPRDWDGQWTWAEGEQPRAALYRSLFRSENAAVPQLEEAYRALALEMREHACTNCHSPDNAFEVFRLELLNYPNQALVSRHTIVAEVQSGRMPPGGIQDAEKKARLVELALEFEKAADDALELEDRLARDAGP